MVHDFAGKKEKLYVSYDALDAALRSAVPRCAAFGPDVIVAIGGGGFVPARLLRTHLRVPILAVSVALYDDATDAARSSVAVQQWFDESYGFGALVRGGRVLVVDDCDDTRTTLAHVVGELARKNGPAAVAALVVHNKRKPKRGALPRDCQYVACADVADRWIVYPWDYAPARRPRDDARRLLAAAAAALALALALWRARR